MIAATENKIVLEPVREMPSEAILVPVRGTRYRNGKLSICGRVVAVGPKVQGVGIGEYAYHSDSCYQPIQEGALNVIRQDDIMFLSHELLPAQWLGAEEVYE